MIKSVKHDFSVFSWLLEAAHTLHTQAQTHTQQAVNTSRSSSPAPLSPSSLSPSLSECQTLLRSADDFIYAVKGTSWRLFLIFLMY
jgi:hypothetical protein